MQHPDYTIIRELGRGGSATVFLAVQKSLNRQVAFKVLHGYAADQGERFLREGRIVAKLNHPNIVPVYDVGTLPDDSGYYMTMEYLQGGSFRDAISDFSLRDLLRTLEQICDALTFAHEQGFVHRDVKPDNILFRSPQDALLADFGIARPTDSETQMTVTGAMLGTPDYMSPEQVSADPVDARSDLYSLGIVIYEALTGYRPFHGDNVMSTGLQHLTSVPTPLPKNVQRWQNLMNRLLAKQPIKRPASADELKQEIVQLAQKWPVDLDSPLIMLHTGDAPKQSSIAATIARQRRRLPMAVLASLGLAVGAAVFYVQTNSPSAVPEAVVADPIEPTEVEILLEQANTAFTTDAPEQWLSDQSDSALALYRQILALEPENAAARDRIDAILNASLARLTRQVDQQDFDSADALMSQLTASFNDPFLVDARDRLSRAKESALAQALARNERARISDLIEQASAALSAGQLTGGNSAASSFRAVLDIDPSNELARSGLANILETLLVQAANAVAARDFDLADQFLADAQLLAPSESRIAQLREDSSTARLAYNAQQQSAAAQAKLDRDIDALAERVDRWLGDPDAALDAGYEDLTNDLKRLLAQAPEERELNRLVVATERQAEQIRARESLAEEAAEPAEEDQERFSRPTF